jgi:hypothetical protein
MVDPGGGVHLEQRAAGLGERPPRIVGVDVLAR